MGKNLGMQTMCAGAHRSGWVFWVFLKRFLFVGDWVFFVCLGCFSLIVILHFMCPAVLTVFARVDRNVKAVSPALHIPPVLLTS